MRKKKKVLVIGLDCAGPELVFDQWRDKLPVLRELMESGTYGNLQSCIPCITVPAWACMMSGKDPGELGLYGFHNRKDFSYNRLSVVSSMDLKEKMIWDLFSAAGRRVVIIGVPPAYPPRAVNGIMVGCFLTPSTEKPFTFPSDLSREIGTLVGSYPVDIQPFRTDDKEVLLSKLYEMTEKHFIVIRHLLEKKDWDLFAFVEIGVDRIHHGLWRFHDPTHPKHEQGNRYQSAILDYYRYLDNQIGRLLTLVDDQTAVLVVSDHGVQKMEGGFCLNEWLIQENYLVLKKPPNGLTSLDKCEVDWERTQVWGGGGYYGRIFINVKGREPQGIIHPDGYDALRRELIGKLEMIKDPIGKVMKNRVFRPQEIYRQCRNIPPDLIVYFGDLSWRSVGSCGSGEIFTFDNDTGPDEANHASNGLFIFYDPKCKGRGRVPDMPLTRIAPLLLKISEVSSSPEIQENLPDFIK